MGLGCALGRGQPTESLSDAVAEVGLGPPDGHLGLGLEQPRVQKRPASRQDIEERSLA